jgi:signal transduction histidine kinase
MPETSSQILTLTIIISTVLLLIFGIIIVRYILLYQQKRYRHQQEVFALREDFTKTLLQSKIEIQEETLNHISKELHANFSQLVSLININLSEILPHCSESIKENIFETKALAKQVLGDLKALSVSLNTEHIMKIGVIKALENELARFEKTKRFNTTISKTGNEYRLLPEREIILFRLCQEALNNILKYAKAKNISVTFDFSETALILKMIDDGMGFDLSSVLKGSGENQSTGILNMQKRAKLIDGALDIQSTIGKGTEVTIVLPK